MTTTAPTRVQLPVVPALSLKRDTLAEARKLIDTRASSALLLATLVLTAGAAAATVVFRTANQSVDRIVSVAAWPGSMLLMVMAMLLVISEFSTGTAAVTFALEPRRTRVLVAKTVVVVGASILLTVFACVMSVLAALVAPLVSGSPVPLAVDGVRLGATAGALLFSALAGLAWGLLTRSAPIPLVLLLAWPTAALLIGSLSDTAATALGYLDLQAPLAFVIDPAHATVRTLTSFAVWIGLPAAIGTWRLVRGDLH